jgi:hypothetical protein
MECDQIVKIKLATNYSTYTVGTVIDCEDETAQRLIRDGIAVREQQMDLIETASVDHDVERADATPRRRGRPPRAIQKPDHTDAASG